MKTTDSFVLGAIVSVLMVSSGFAEDKKFDPEQMIRQFREVVKPTQEEFERLKPELENQGIELKGLFDKYKKQWMETLPMVEKDLEKVAVRKSGRPPWRKSERGESRG